MRRTLRSLAPILAPAALLLALAGCSNVSLNNSNGAQPVAAQGSTAVVDPVGIYIAQTEAATGLSAMTVPGGVIYMQRVPVLTRADLTDAAAMVDQHGQNFVGLRFTDAGARKLALSFNSLGHKYFWVLLPGPERAL